MELLPLPHRFHRRHRIPPVRPLHQHDIVLGISFLDFAGTFLIVSFNTLQVLIGKLAPLLFQFIFELHPFLLELIRMHRMSSRGTYRYRTFTLTSDHHAAREMRHSTVWIRTNMIPIWNRPQETGGLRVNHAPNEQEAQEMGQSASFTPRSITLVSMRPAVKIFNKNIHANLDGARILRMPLHLGP